MFPEALYNAVQKVPGTKCNATFQAPVPGVVSIFTNPGPVLVVGILAPGADSGRHVLATDFG